MIHWNTQGPRYMDASTELASGSVVLLGAPYDGTTSFRPGARFGPDALRDASPGLETYSPALDRDLSEVRYADVGNLPIPPGGAAGPVLEQVAVGTRALLDAGCTPLLLGGEHTLTVGAVGALAERHPDLLVVQLDAHADLRQDYLGDRLSHACTMRRVLDHGVNLLQVGIRSGTREEFEEMRAGRRWISPPRLEEALADYAGAPVYLTVDLDVFDPGVFPGTGTPEPGGWCWADFAGVLNALAVRQLVGADVVELAPMLDSTGCSAVLAAKVVRELILVMGR